MTAITKSTPGWCIILVFMLLPVLSKAQPGASVSLDKPKKYEKRILASEKSADSKFNIVKKANQNLNTRYNFFFNSERKLTDIMTNARASFRDDYGFLLPFYNYSLDATASQKIDLDSIKMKCNDAILLHDLRNDWVDDLYLMMGKAYYFSKNFDSAAIAFQYVNYAFQPRTKDEIGNIKYVGSNANETGNVYTISTRESKNPAKQLVGHTPARNESLIWLTKALVEKEHFGEAWGLIETLRKDVNFPKRLNNDLDEVTAYLYYRQESWDSASAYLERSLDNASDMQERARWEYLLAQLHELINLPEEADSWYNKAITHTTDPILEAYARINRIRLVAGDDENKRIDMNIAELMRMVKRDKYEDYKHIIYYAAARMELSRQQYEPAMEYLKLSGKNSTNDPLFRNKVFLDLAEIAFEQRKYKVSAMGYDSVDINDPAILEPDKIQERKLLLAEILKHFETIRVEDSLLRIAKMPEQEIESYVKSMVRKLRKEKGLKEEAAANANYMGGVSSVVDPTKQDQPVDLFAANSKGDWYFYNTGMKSKGSREFKTIWGNRPNVDNWRRAKAISAQALAFQPQTQKEVLPNTSTTTINSKTTPSELTTEALMANIPLTPEQVKASNDSIAFALHALGKIFMDRTGDCQSLIPNNEDLLNRYAQSVYAEEAMFQLYYCHMKNGDVAKANFYKDYMSRTYAQSKFVRMIKDPIAAGKEEKSFETAATKKYEDIYNSFIEGDFTRALAEKKAADSVYGENFWTPQLLYIESVYQIQQRDDTAAIETLKKMIALYPQSPMSEKAKNIIEVLGRRTEIENYLTNLDITRAEEENIAVDLDTEKADAKKPISAVVTPQKVQAVDPGLKAPEVPKEKESVGKTPVKAGDVKADNRQPLSGKIDSSTFKAPAMEKKAEGYSFVPADQYIVVLLLEKVDIVYINEARNALNRYNKDKYSGKNFELSSSIPFDDTRKMITIATFMGVVEANDYVNRARASAASEIFPWMPKDKYSFFLVSTGNIELLKSRKDVKQYLDLLQQNIPLK